VPCLRHGEEIPEAIISGACMCSGAGAIKQAAAIIQSEGVFIDSSPLGKAAASRQAQQISSIFELESGALRIFGR
jgi:hypothetical protein